METFHLSLFVFPSITEVNYHANSPQPRLHIVYTYITFSTKPQTRKLSTFFEIGGEKNNYCIKNHILISKNKVTYAKRKRILNMNNSPFLSFIRKTMYQRR